MSTVAAFLLGKSAAKVQKGMLHEIRNTP